MYHLKKKSTAFPLVYKKIPLLLMYIMIEIKGNLHYTNLNQPQIISNSLSSACFTFSGFCPPAWAISGRPPPLPPTMGAISFMIFPAWYRPVRS
jgi:hypothetical protein